MPSPCGMNCDNAWILLVPSPGLAAPKATLADLPLPAHAAIATTLGKDQPAYHAQHQDAGVTFENPRYGFTATLAPKGLTMTQGCHLRS